MIRCQAELEERTEYKKTHESALAPLGHSDLTTFEELVARDGAAWRSVADADSLRCAAARARGILRSGDYQRFLLWLITERGLALARAAGLIPTRLRVEYAS